MDVMVATGEEMAQFVGEKNGQQSDGKGKAGQEGGGIFVEESKGADEFVEGGGLIVSVGNGELRACGQTSAEGEEKKGDGEDEGFERRTRENRNVILGARGNIAPISGSWKRIHCGI